MVISVDLSLVVVSVMMWMTLLLLQTHVAVQFLKGERGDSIKNQFPEVIVHLFTRKFLAISYRAESHARKLIQTKRAAFVIADI